MARGFSCRLPSCRNEDFVSPIAAYTLLGTGAIFNGVGVPLYISGANELARNQSPPAPPPALSLAF